MKSLKTRSLLLFSFYISTVFAQTPIDPSIFGQNAWFITNSNPVNLNGIWLSQIKFSGVNYVRIGGIAQNWNTVSAADLQTLVSNIKSAGMQVIIQVPFDGNLGTINTQANNAAALVTTMNSSSSTSCLNWIISNEPDGTVSSPPWGFGWDQPGTEGGYIKTFISTFSIAMKGADPRIKIIGPGLFDYKTYTGLVQDLTGINSVLPWIDYFSYHYYPFNNQGAAVIGVPLPTRSNVINFLQTGAPRVGGGNSTPFLTDLNELGGWIGSTKKIAITEANLCHKNDVDAVNGADDTWGGVGANSFLAGQFDAEMYCLAMYSGKVKFMNMWSIMEGNNVISDGDPGGNTGNRTNVGYLDNITGNRKSSYWHYRFLGKNFSGKIYMPVTKTGAGSQNVKIFASKSCTGIALLVMNQNQSAINIGINLNSNSPSTPISVTMGNVANSINILEPSFGPEETRLYLMDACGKLISTTIYNVAGGSTSTPLTTTSAASRFCRCYDFTLYNPSNSTAKCATPDSGSGHFNNDNLTKSFSLIANVGSVTGTLKVTGNSVLTIQDAEIVFAPGAKIEVQPGSKLIIKNSYLHGCEGGQIWGGLDVKGNNNTTAQIIIDGSQIWDAQVAVKAENIKDLFITGTSFHNGLTAVEMDRVQGFQIRYNEISNFTYGIKTSKTIISTSTIKENYFSEVKYAVFSENDNHSKLDITCNTFEKYSDFAIYSDNSIMKDQGSLTNGAGNLFISNSTQINHKLRHNGNSINYYYDPSNPMALVTGNSLNALAQAATSDGSCNQNQNARISEQSIIEENALPIEAAFTLQTFPNPFKDQLTILFTLPVDSKGGTIKIYEIASGKEIYTSAVTSGQNKLVIDQLNIAEGIYICNIISDNGSSKQFKLINIK